MAGLLIVLAVSTLLLGTAAAEKKDSQPLAGKTLFLTDPAPAPTPAAKTKTSPSKATPAKPAASKAVPPPAAKATPPPTKPEPKSGGLLGLLPFGKRSESAPPAPTKPIEKSAPKTAVAKPNVPAVTPKPQLSKTAEATVKPKADQKAKPEVTPPAEPKKPGFFARLLGGKADEGTASNKATSGNLPPRPADWESKYIVTDDRVEAYRFGPSQPNGPDEYLVKGTVVELKKGGKAWADITLENGRIYTVGADQIRKAREDDFARPVVAQGPTLPGGVPLPMGDLEPLPTVELPETGAQPKKSLDATELLLPPLPPP